MVGGPLFLTLQSPNMISVIDAVLWLHLRITGLAQFVIFCILQLYLSLIFAPECRLMIILDRLPFFGY